MKLLFTTNTTWAGTEAMTRNLVASCVAKAPSGARAFPSPQQCLHDAPFWRDFVRAGYRADAARQLAEGFVSGRLTDEQFLRPQPAAELWDRITSLHGFGPYAAGQAMRLLGHYEELALDSWCRAQFAQRAGRKKPPADRTIAKRYAKYAPFQGLAMWLDLTAPWHGE
jgi:N-glycosylase/DNA lyase